MGRIKPIKVFVSFIILGIIVKIITAAIVFCTSANASNEQTNQGPYQGNEYRSGGYGSYESLYEELKEK